MSISSDFLLNVAYGTEKNELENDPLGPLHNCCGNVRRKIYDERPPNDINVVVTPLPF